MIENNLKNKKSRQTIWDEYRNIKIDLIRDFINVMKK
jgi:hypothetical protein